MHFVCIHTDKLLFALCFYTHQNLYSSNDSLTFLLDMRTMPTEVALYWLYRETGALPSDHLLVDVLQAR